MPQNLKHWNDEFDRLSKLSDQTLYKELGVKIASQSGGGGGRGRVAHKVVRKPGFNYSEHAHKWLDRRLAEYRDRICNDQRIRELINGKNNTARDLFLVLVDILGALKLHIPVGRIAMILLRHGLNELCGFNVKTTDKG